MYAQSFEDTVRNDVLLDPFEDEQLIQNHSHQQIIHQQVLLEIREFLLKLMNFEDMTNFISVKILF